jgi:hypothetical protein
VLQTPWTCFLFRPTQIWKEGDNKKNLLVIPKEVLSIVKEMHKNSIRLGV